MLSHPSTDDHAIAAAAAAALAADTDTDAAGGQFFEFEWDPHLLREVIERQGGSQVKALAELVMNSVDAGASRVDITLTKDSLTLRDNGRGFADGEDIMRNFRRFGRPHEAGDAHYGRYRIGRGQVMNYGVSTWTSGKFRMQVDLRKGKLGFVLSKVDPPQPGCTMECAYFEALTNAQLRSLSDTLAETCRYVEAQVVIDGVTVSRSPAACKWTHVDDDAYILVNPDSTRLHVYNLGVLVTYYAPYHVGIGGVVVSRKALELNLARNEVMMTKCEVWKRIVKTARGLVKDRPRSLSNTRATRAMMRQKLAVGEFDGADEFCAALNEAKVFTDYGGRHHTLLGLKTRAREFGSTLCAPTERTQVAESVHSTGLGLVLAPDMARAVPGVESFADYLTRLERVALEFDRCSRSQYYAKCIAELRSHIVDCEAQYGERFRKGPEPVLAKSLDKRTRLVLRVLDEQLSPAIARALSVKARTVQPMRCTTRKACTDSRSSILIEVGELKVGGTPAEVIARFERLRSVLLHEYLHEGDTFAGHDHPPEFYAAFHDAVVFNEGVRVAVPRAVSFFGHLLRRSGIKMRASDAVAMDVCDDGTADDGFASDDAGPVAAVQSDALAEPAAA